MLGKPTPQEIKAMNAAYTGKLPDIEPIPMKKLLSFASPLGIDLLSKMLRYNPKDRIQPIDALLHPFFDSLRISPIKINGKEIVDLFDFSEEELKGYENKRSGLIPKWYLQRKSQI